ncbi:hypothetical protein DSO57_1033882 [Entomophthora muscae]|uniref:Uncharacterized protein n=1 Tax=Entomophthora muscae TaxID=34485 RepID=A0ACC2S254_9FUNG|nr:hypothetical protein DSO57_1033882 [Entomophthora muscae]
MYGMISTFYIAAVAVLVLAYKLYLLFSVPEELKDVPAIPIGATMASMLRGESFDVRFERLIRPALAKTGMARTWNQGRWDLAVGDIQQTKEILAKSDTFLKQRDNDESLKTMLTNKILGLTNIAMSDGDEWRRHRRIANPAFKKTWSTDMFAGCTQKLINLINQADGAPLQIQDLFQRLTLDVLGKGLFSFNFEAIAKGNENHYLRLYNDVMKAMFNPIYFVLPFLEKWVPSRQKSHQQSQEFRDFLRNIIRTRKGELTDSHDDLLSLMTRASVEEKEFVLSEDEVINDLSLFFLAGHDTTANTLTTIFYYLSKHQDIQEKARQEVNRVLNGEKRIPTAYELKQLHYINSIIKESMRIVSTVPQLQRYCKESQTLSNGFVIPKETFILLELWKIHHDEKLYPDPYSFNPERFKDSHLVQDNQWMAFGHGTRMCLGKNFSLMEQRVVISMMLQTFTFSLGPDIAKLKNPKICSSGLLHPVNVDIVFTPIA